MNFGVILAIVAALIFGWALLNTPPARLARIIRQTGPVLIMAAGVVMALAGRFGAGLPLILIGLMLLRRMQGVSRMAGGPNARSNVRSAALEMTLDHDTGEMDGEILAGTQEGRRLSDLSDNELIDLRVELQSDEESILLLEAYLDRRIPGWREDADGDFAAGKVGTPGSGPMSKQEAYEVLGLGPGAAPAEIRKAHRRLMKGMHPDSGGSTFLAAKINEAKEVLLKSHS